MQVNLVPGLVIPDDGLRRRTTVDSKMNRVPRLRPFIYITSLRIITVAVQNPILPIRLNAICSTEHTIRVPSLYASIDRHRIAVQRAVQTIVVSEIRTGIDTTATTQRAHKPGKRMGHLGRKAIHRQRDFTSCH